MKQRLLYGIVGAICAALIISLFFDVYVDLETRKVVLKKAYSIHQEIVDTMPSQASSVLVTNLNMHKIPEGPIREYLYPVKVFDYSILAYTKSYAERFGLENEWVRNDLPAGLRMIEFEHKNIGGHSQCKLKLLLDSNLPIAWPSEEWRYPYIQFNEWKYGNPASKREADEAFRKAQMKKFANANRKAAQLYSFISRYTENDKEKTAGYFLTVTNYTKEYHYDSSGVELLVFGCSSAADMFARGQMHLKLTRKGFEDIDIYERRKMDEAFLDMPLPKDLFLPAVPWLQEAKRFAYTSYLHRMRREPADD